MSEPIKKPNQVPDSHSPKKPEILSMAEGMEIKLNVSEGASTEIGFPKKRNVLSTIGTNTELHYFPNAMSVCMEYFHAINPDNVKHDVPLIFVGVWPLAEGTYDPGLNNLKIPTGANIFGLFDEEYNKYPTPKAITGYTSAASIAELEEGKYCIVNASSGFAYVVTMSKEFTAITVSIPSRTEFDYIFISGVSGAAFSATWLNMRQESADITQEWDAPIEHVFRACGYDYKLMHAETPEEAKDLYKSAAIASIDKGIPVLAQGVAGPPVFNVIAGYDDYGDTLLGTGFFTRYSEMFNFKLDNEYPKFFAQKRSDWTLDELKIITFGKKQPFQVLMNHIKMLLNGLLL